MGIDIYMEWDDMTEEEKDAQYQGFSSVIGHKGYLREAYHGGPYATPFLVSEAFKNKGAVHIPAETLRERLPEARHIAISRMEKVYHLKVRGNELAITTLEKFVELAEQLEAEDRNPRIRASW